MRGTAHIFFHVAHAVSGFYIQSTGIETNAFANNGNFWMRFVAPVQFN